MGGEKWSDWHKGKTHSAAGHRLSVAGKATFQFTMLTLWQKKALRPQAAPRGMPPQAAAFHTLYIYGAPTPTLRLQVLPALRRSAVSRARRTQQALRHVRFHLLPQRGRSHGGRHHHAPRTVALHRAPTAARRRHTRPARRLRRPRRKPGRGTAPRGARGTRRRTGTMHLPLLPAQRLPLQRPHRAHGRRLLPLHPGTRQPAPSSRRRRQHRLSPTQPAATLTLRPPQHQPRRSPSAASLAHTPQPGPSTPCAPRSTPHSHPTP